jgi:DNA-binding response OmpR family regulator
MSDVKKVLLIDDDPDFTLANRIALEAKGFKVVVAGCASEGAEKAVQERPDLIVADLMMEELHAGFALVEELASDHATAGIPVLMVSGVTTETGFRVDQNGQKPGWLHVRAFLNKPIDPVELAERVAAELKR